MKVKIQKFKKLLNKIKSSFLNLIKRFKKRLKSYTDVLETRKFVFFLTVTLSYIVFAYIYEYNAIRTESNFLVNSFSKQIDFSVATIADYLKVNGAYYDNIFSIKNEKEHYITNNLHWNTENFYTLDNFNRYNIYDYGNLTGFGTHDGVIGIKDEISVVLNGNEIYKEIYINHQDYVHRSLYSSENGFAYTYPYSLSKYYSYADRLVVESGFENIIEYNDIKWSDIFVDVDKNKFAMSLLKEITHIENGIRTKIGTLAVDISLPEYNVLENYQYYVVDENFEILGTNDNNIKPEDGVVNIYQLKDTFKKSNLTESIKNEEQLFSFNGEIFSVKKIDSAPLYFIIVKDKFYMLNHLYYVVTASFASIFVSVIVFQEYFYHKRAQKQRSNKIRRYKVVNQRLEEHLEIDYLTGLYCKEMVLSYCEKLFKNKAEFTVVIIEIDRYININEIYGRVVIDKITKNVSNIIYEKVGDQYIVGRLSGSRIICILENVDVKKATEFANEICEEVSEEYFSLHQEICLRLTVSCGVAEQRYIEGEDHLTTIDNANSATLEAKGKGRNRVVNFKPKTLT